MFWLGPTLNLFWNNNGLQLAISSILRHLARDEWQEQMSEHITYSMCFGNWLISLVQFPHATFTSKGFGLLVLSRCGQALPQRNSH